MNLTTCSHWTGCQDAPSVTTDLDGNKLPRRDQTAICYPKPWQTICSLEIRSTVSIWGENSAGYSRQMAIKLAEQT